MSALAVTATLLVPVVAAAPASAAPGDITTYAGGGVGDGGPATSAYIAYPGGVATDSAGNLYISSQYTNRIRKVTPAGIITTVAGTGQPGFSGDGGPATAAMLNGPSDVTLDPAGNLYIADTSNARVRKVDTFGIITTIAGSGEFFIPGDDTSGDGGPALQAATVPLAVAADGFGNVFLSENDSRVRKISGGIIDAFAGQIFAYSYGGDDGPALDAQLNQPVGLATDVHGSVFIADQYNMRIRKVDTAGIITTVAGDGGGDPFGGGFGGDGGPATQAQLSIPSGVALNPAGEMFIVDQGNNVIRKVVPGADGVIDGEADEIITTVAGIPGEAGYSGDGGQAVAARINFPQDVAADGFGNFFIADINNTVVRKVAPNGIITTFAGGGVGDGVQAAAALVTQPYGVTIATGGTYISEQDDNFNQDPRVGNRVRLVLSSGVITTVAGGQTGFSGDGGPATSAALRDPRGMAVDTAGNLFIADCGNDRVRRVTPGPDGVVNGGPGEIITTVAGGGTEGVGDGGPATSAQLNCPSGVDVVTSGPQTGTLYIAEADGHRVRKVVPGANGVVDGAPDDFITTVAGTGTAGYNGDNQPAVSALLNTPTDVLVDPAGNLYIADRENHRVRKVDPGGTITTVAGNGSAGFGTNGVPATSTSITQPTGLARDAAGNLYITEPGFARVRKVDPGGIITLFAGTSIPGFSGDGGQAIAAQFNQPTQVDVDAAGNVYITDRVNNRVRRVESGTPPPPPDVIGCGQVLTKSIELTADLGPCPGDGLVIGADNITVKLKGHRIFGVPAKGHGVGIRIVDRKGVKIDGAAAVTRGQRGTISEFDSGVVVVGGSRNTITNLNVVDNLSPSTGDPPFGDGIGLFFSPLNTISNNFVKNNGIYDGIGLLGIGTDNNVVLNNRVEDTPGDGIGIVMNAYLDDTLPREIAQSGNRVIGNLVQNNHRSGISTIGNVRGVISDNTVLGNGIVGVEPGNGIAIQPLLFAGGDGSFVVLRNQVHGNSRSGIEITSRKNTIRDNDASNNNALPNNNPFAPSADLEDRNVNCDSNTWFGNVWGSGGFRPPCTTTGGHAAPGTSAQAAQVGPAQAGEAAPQGTQANGGRSELEEQLRVRGHPPQPR